MKIFTQNIALIAMTILMTFTFLSCERRTLTDASSKTYPNIDPELWIYFQRFEEAATERGRQVDLKNFNISAKIKKLEVDNIIALCHYNINEPNQILIDEEFWEQSSILKRELAIFHELGHCYLKLPHREDADQDGRCKSIMSSGMSDCIENYTNENRETYQDELFY